MCAVRTFLHVLGINGSCMPPGPAALYVMHASYMHRCDARRRHAANTCVFIQNTCGLYGSVYLQHIHAPHTCPSMALLYFLVALSRDMRLLHSIDLALRVLSIPQVTIKISMHEKWHYSTAPTASWTLAFCIVRWCRGAQPAAKAWTPA